MDCLGLRLDRLRSWQGQDGGWGYFPGKQSWLEPSVWAALALARDPSSKAQAARAWDLIRGWQNADGGWRPSAAASASAWGTSLALTLADVLGCGGTEIDRGVRWLAAGAGAESSLLHRVLRVFRLSGAERDISHAGWPWRPGTSAWVEPTVHALVALKKFAHRTPELALAARIRSGEQMLLSVRCGDGGWNYGSPRALGIELPSYAETTALALLGLRDRAPADSVSHARRLAGGDVSPLARAWLRLALSVNGTDVATETPVADSMGDILLIALESLDPRLLDPGARA